MPGQEDQVRWCHSRYVTADGLSCIAVHGIGFSIQEEVLWTGLTFKRLVCDPCARKFGKSDQCRYSTSSSHARSISRVSKHAHADKDRVTPSPRSRTVQPKQLPVLRPAERLGGRQESQASDTAPETDNAVDSMNAIVEGQSVEFFGGSSAGSFTGQIKAAIAERMGHLSPVASSGRQNHPSRLHRSSV